MNDEQPMNPMELPAEIRVNVLLNELLNMVEHMTQLKEMIDHVRIGRWRTTRP